MIENFSLINENSDSAEVDYDEFGNINISYEARVKIIYNSKSRGIQWYHKGKCYKFFDNEYNIEGLPSIDRTKVLVLYHKKDLDSTDTENARIYHANGKLFKSIEFPKLISPISEKYYKKLAHPQTMFFESSRYELIEGKPTLIVKIGFNRDWYEERVLDISKGIWGLCYSSGRR